LYRSLSTKPNFLIQVRDKWFRILAVLLPLLLMMYVNDVLGTPTTSKVLRTLVSLLTIIMISEGSRLLVYKGHQKFSPKYRLLLFYLFGLLWTASWLSISSILRQYISTGMVDFAQMKDTNIVINDKKLIVGLFGYSLLNAIVNFSALLVMYLILYHQAKLRFAEAQTEKLEKEKLKAELLQLKGIVNPHFLFNNLNSLSSLISEDPEKAQEFLDELTQVFRYLLRNNQTELTTLSEELKFIRTYYQLLRTRYGAGIHMDLKIDETYSELLLPPLTLQLLVENAVKHNRVHKDYPLHIELIPAPGKKLMVRNSISRKEGKVESTGIGLQTINSRYKMLNNAGVVIEQDDVAFTVLIPLIEQQAV
jgi:sensor histidine kinase YesM